MPSLEQVQKQATDFVSGLSVKQRALLVAGTIVTIAVLALFVRLIGTPDYKPLVTGMEPADAEALGAKLAAKNIQYQISSDGKSVSVPSDQIDSSRMDLASDGMPHSGRMGFELFDKVNWGQTEFDEKVNYQRALEGELERSIQTLNDVESVRVHLVLPTDSVFIDRERKAKASVILKLKSGRISDQTQTGIARLVAGAVDGLSPDDVTVIDADTHRPLGSGRRDAFSGSENLEQQLSAQLVQTLEPVVGPDHVRAQVNVEFDPSTSEESDETYDPKSQVAVSEQKSEEEVGGVLAGGVPGTSSNVPGGSNAPQPATQNATAATKPTPGATTSATDTKDNASAKASAETPYNPARMEAEPGDGTQLSKSESSTFAVNKVVRHIMEPAGRIRRISAALLIDDAVEVTQQNGKRQETRRKRTPDELKQIEQLAQAAIGVDTTRGDVLTVQNLSFDQTPVEAPAKPSVMQKVRVTLSDWSSLVRYGALILLFLLAYALFLRPLKKQLMTTFRELPAAISAKKQGVAGVDLPPGQDLATLPPQQQRSITLKKQLLDKVNAEPVATSKLIQAWIHEEAK
jgi:flagellar M-ring protein FliF